MNGTMKLGKKTIAQSFKSIALKYLNNKVKFLEEVL